MLSTARWNSPISFEVSAANSSRRGIAERDEREDDVVLKNEGGIDMSTILYARRAGVHEGRLYRSDQHHDRILDRESQVAVVSCERDRVRPLNGYHFWFGVWSGSANPPFNFYRTYSPNGWALQGAKRYTNYEFSKLIAFLIGPAGVLLCGGVGDAVFRFDETTYGRNNGARAYSTIHSKTGACTNLTHYAHWDGFGWSS